MIAEEREKIYHQKQVDLLSQAYTSFDFYTLGRESTTCFILELMWNHILEKAENTPVMYKLKELSTDPIIIQSFIQLKKLLVQGGVSQKTYEEIHYPRTIFARHWYASFKDFCTEHAEIFSSNDSRNTGIIYPENISFNGKQIVSLAGEWFLGVLRGSVNKKRALDIIENDMTSVAANTRILNHRVGLPARIGFYKHDKELNELLKCYEYSKSRTMIIGYEELRHVLYEEFKNIIEFSFRDDEECKEKIIASLIRIDYAVDNLKKK